MAVAMAEVDKGDIKPLPGKFQFKYFLSNRIIVVSGKYTSKLAVYCRLSAVLLSEEYCS